METTKPLARAGYLLGILLVLIPLYDAITKILPLHLSEERWRFGAIGQLSNELLIPLLGLFIVIMSAAVADSGRIKRVVGGVCGILAVLLGIMCVLFILDYFQVRTTVTPQYQHSVATVTSVALIKHVLFIVALALLCRAGFAGPKITGVKKVAPPSPTGSTPLIPLGGAERAE